MGVLGREPWIMAGGARLNGENTCPAVWTFLKSVNPSPAEDAGAIRVGVIGVIGVTPLDAVVPKNCVPKIPGEIGIPCAGNTNLVISLRVF